MADYESVEGCLIHLPRIGYVVWPSKNPPKRITYFEIYQLDSKPFKKALKGHHVHEYKLHSSTQTFHLKREA